MNGKSKLLFRDEVVVVVVIVVELRQKWAYLTWPWCFDPMEENVTG